MPPKVFISYSHDSPEHEAWVLALATRLVADGIDVVLDAWILRGGADLAQFMEHSIRTSDRVLVICTERYVERVNNRDGGAGYEFTMISAAIRHNQGTTKFIPILRQQDNNDTLPECLQNRVYFNMNDDGSFEFNYFDLLQDLHDRPKHERPPIGRSPFAERVESDDAQRGNH